MRTTDARHSRARWACPMWQAPTHSRSAGFPGPPTDLSIEPGRLYVDGIQIEAFAEDGATYNNQPFFPPQLGRISAAGASGRRRRRRLSRRLGSRSHLHRRSGPARRRTRRRRHDDAAANCLAGARRPDAGRRLRRAGRRAAVGRTSDHAGRSRRPRPTIPASCRRPRAIAGWRTGSIASRSIRAAPLGAARFKWSRDNGSIVSAVRDIAVSGAQTTLTVNRIGRDQFLRFRVGDWVTCHGRSSRADGRDRAKWR